ncbi:MAG: hypothetical protein FJ263_11150 [Planctomycetes bacterium]|nr:hypothetical protein [Planctomycetota bacterium]
MNTRKWYLVSIAVLGVALFAAMTTAKESCKMKDIPKLVMTAVGNLFPSATVEKAEPENTSFAAYEVDVKEGADTKSAVIAADGTVVSVETKVAAESLPEAVSKAISKNAKGGKILIIEKEEIYMEARLVKLAQPKVMYEAKVVMDGKTIEIEMDAVGNILNTKAEDADEEGDDDEDDDEQTISLDKLPEAVRTAIVNAAEGGDIKEVESEQEHGQTVYEAEVIINGQKFEIKVSTDGKIIEKKAEQNDDDDDDDKKEDKD